MIVALLALALAMIIGGVLAAFFGWDIVLVERGWTMVIAGSISAASGALLLGIAAAVSKLARIENRLLGLQTGSGGDGFGTSNSTAGTQIDAGAAGVLVSAEAAGSDEERTDESQPTLPLFEEERRQQDEPTVAAAEWPEDRDAAPVIPFPPRTSAVSLPPQDEEPELRVPDFLLADRERNDEGRPLVANAGSEVDGLEQGEHEHGGNADRNAHDERMEPDSSEVIEAELLRETEPAAAEVDHETSREKEEPSDDEGSATIVGTYNSGDNKYVMFSDGSIEAQTPSGVFRFQSLDELKEFIAAGGESNSSATL